MPDSQLTAFAAPPQIFCRIRFGATVAAADLRAGAPSLAVALPVLAGSAEEVILPDAAAPESREGCTVFSAGGERAGFAIAPAEVDIESAARELYGRVFSAVRGHRLCRIWNYVPEINAVSDGLENYRRFCRGRSLAFESRFGRGFQRQLPAASAVGTRAGPLAVAFLAVASAVRHFENPGQTPAFEYPPDYGPRPPSFSRASWVAPGGRPKLFLSGTAAIRGHLTVGPDDLDAQLPCTLANLRLIAETAGAGEAVGATEGWQRTFKVYLRHARDLQPARHFLERHLLRAADKVTYLQAGICRADLRIEIEAVLTK